MNIPGFQHYTQPARGNGDRAAKPGEVVATAIAAVFAILCMVWLFLANPDL